MEYAGLLSRTRHLYGCSVEKMILESIFVLVLLVSGTQSLTTTNVVIDGYTVNSTLNSPATLPLGTTIILVCRLSGIPHGLQTNYHWTCPNGPCQQTGYAGRKINNNNIIVINITSTSDGGTYTCNATAEGREATQQFQLKVTGGQVVHSYGRLILEERVITDKQQLQPPNNDSGNGRIECRVSSGEARFTYHGRTVPTGTSGDVHQIRSGSTATVVIRDRAFNNFVNLEGNCAGIYHYLFLSGGTLSDVSITGTTRTDTSITVNIGTIPSGIDRVIIGYHRLDLGVPVGGEYVNNGKTSTSRTFSSLVPGAKYRITAWGFGGTQNKRRNQSPAVREVTTMEKIPSPSRHLTITRVFDEGIELNWIPPREPNGDIRHYIVKYTTQDGTQEINTTNNINYYNLTLLQRGQTYNNITVVAVNSAGSGGGSQPITSYVRNSTVESTKWMPSTPCTTSNNGAPSQNTIHGDFLWVCRSGNWLPYKLLPSIGTTKHFAASSCKEIRSAMSNDCHSPPTSGTFSVNVTDPCGGHVRHMEVYCEMSLDGGGWTMVWKHSYMQVGSLTEDMKYFSDYYKPCADLEVGWCNVPNKIRFKPTEMMIVAYHNKEVVYAYKGIYNGGLDVNWSGGVLISPVKIVDQCRQKNGVPPDPLIQHNLGGLAFDKYNPGNYLSQSDTYHGTFSSPTDCRFINCQVYVRSQMTMAIYVR